MDFLGFNELAELFSSASIYIGMTSLHLLLLLLVLLVLLLLLLLVLLLLFPFSKAEIPLHAEIRVSSVAWI